VFAELKVGLAAAHANMALGEIAQRNQEISAFQKKLRAADARHAQIAIGLMLIQEIHALEENAITCNVGSPP